MATANLYVYTEENHGHAYHEQFPASGTIVDAIQYANVRILELGNVVNARLFISSDLYCDRLITFVWDGNDRWTRIHRDEDGGLWFNERLAMGRNLLIPLRGRPLLVRQYNSVQ